MSAGCAIDSCGVVARGRCSTCGRAFCMSHQGVSATVTYSDLCLPCLMRREAEAYAKNPIHDQVYIQSGQASADLASSGITPVSLHVVKRSTKYKRFGRSEEIVTVKPGGQAWIIGNFDWKYNNGGNYGGVDIVGEHITAIREKIELPRSGGLVRLQEDPERSGYLFRGGDCQAGWTVLASRVREILREAPGSVLEHPEVP